MRRVAVLGASNVVGAAVMGRLKARLQARADDVALRALVRDTGRAGRVARLGVEIVAVDLADPTTLRVALEGCSHLVDAVSDGATAPVGSASRIRAVARGAGITRLVHVARWTPASDVPDPTAPETVVVRAPMLSGPGAPGLLAVVAAARAGRLTLVDDGAIPWPSVDVGDLARAVEDALDSRDGGATWWVAPPRTITWRALVEALQPLVPVTAIPSLGAREAASLVARPSPSAGRALRHLVGSDVRAVLRRDPWWAAFEQRVRTVAARARRPALVEALPEIARPERARPDPALLRAQLAPVGVPPLSVVSWPAPCDPVVSVAAFVRWYAAMHGGDAPAADLLRDV